VIDTVSRWAAEGGSADAVEYIRYPIAQGPGAEFEPAYRQASAVRNDNPHRLGPRGVPGVWRVRNGFIVRIPWDTVEGHQHGFRSSSTVKPFRSRSRA
jgi:hypothetical protein